MAFKSLIMTAFEDDDSSCPICKYINGDVSPDVSNAVIGRLDAALAERERQANELIQALVYAKRE